MSDVHHHEHAPRPRTPLVVRILMFALLGVIGYYVITEHSAHLFAALPLLILAACPLMHLFHGGHGGHHHGAEPPPPTNQTNTGGQP